MPTKATAVNAIKKGADIINNRECIAENFDAHFVEMGAKIALEIPDTTISPTTSLKLQINVNLSLLARNV